MIRITNLKLNLDGAIDYALAQYFSVVGDKNKTLDYLLKISWL